jgi:hypothetical protein
MSTPVGRRSNLLLVTLLLVISILVEQFFIAPILPWLGNLGSIRPMIVFLDIPLELPNIDLLPVSILFALFYQIAPSAGLSREHPSISSGARVWKGLTGWWTLFVLLLAGGGLFHLAQNYLPRSVGNGIDSFGVRADLTLPYPSGDLIHLHGSVVMLAFSSLGILILNRRTATPAQDPIAEPRPAEALSSSVVSSTGTLISPTINEVFSAQQQRQPQLQPLPQPEHDHARYQPSTIIPGYEKPLIAEAPAPAPRPAPRPAPEPAATAVAVPPAPKQAPAAVAAPVAQPTEKRYQPVTILPGQNKPVNPAARPTIITPEPPPTCRLTTPPPIAVVMPRPAPGVGKMHPCFVIGSLRPVKIP